MQDSVVQELHNTYQTLKQGTEKLYAVTYDSIDTVVVTNIKKRLDSTLRSLEDVLGITQAARDGKAQLAQENKPKTTSVDKPGVVDANKVTTEPDEPEVPVDHTV